MTVIMYFFANSLSFQKKFGINIHQKRSAHIFHLILLRFLLQPNKKLHLLGKISWPTTWPRTYRPASRQRFWRFSLLTSGEKKLTKINWREGMKIFWDKTEPPTMDLLFSSFTCSCSKKVPQHTKLSSCKPEFWISWRKKFKKPPPLMVFKRERLIYKNWRSTSDWQRDTWMGATRILMLSGSKVLLQASSLADKERSSLNLWQPSRISRSL